jgi:lipopolysaccharide biosynthesis regulator YciM
MSSSDRMLVPACTCGKNLSLSTLKSMPQGDVTHVRIYRCASCHHEMRLIIWGSDACEGAAA